MSEKVPKAADVLFETVEDASSGVIALHLEPDAVKYLDRQVQRGEKTVAFFLPEKVLNKLLLQMAYAIQRRDVQGRLWTPGTL